MEDSGKSRFEIRRQEHALAREDAERILREAEYGTLAMTDFAHGNEPYAVPISFAFFGNAIFIHSAMAGRKFKILAAGARVHFSVVLNSKPVFTKYFTNYFESAMAVGECVPVSDENEKREALRALCRKYLPERTDVADEHISRLLARTAVFKIVPEIITGKRKGEF